MSKKNTLFLSLFVVLAVLAGVVAVINRPTAGNDNPLSRLTKDKLDKIEIKNKSLVSVFERKEDKWLVTNPFNDHVNSAFDDLIGSVLDFTIESVVSTNKDKHSVFQIQDGEATELTVFAKGKDKPLLEGLFGKAGKVYGSTYFRFKGEDSVRLVNDFPIYFLQRRPIDYRERQVFLLGWDDLTGISIQSEDESLSIERSSDTWVYLDTGKNAFKPQLENLKRDLAAIKVTEFFDEEGEISFDKPFLDITLKAGDEAERVVVGPLLEKEEGKAERRYFKKDGRDAILILPDIQFEHIRASLKRPAEPTPASN